MAKKKEPLNFEVEVPVYYHWFGIILYDKFNEPEGDEHCILREYISRVSDEKLNIVIARLIAIQEHQRTENEHTCSALLQQALDRFGFNMKLQ